MVELVIPCINWSSITGNCDNKTDDIALSPSFMDLLTMTNCAANLEVNNRGRGPRRRRGSLQGDVALLYVLKTEIPQFNMSIHLLLGPRQTIITCCILVIFRSLTLNTRHVSIKRETTHPAITSSTGGSIDSQMRTSTHEKDRTQNPGYYRSEKKEKSRQT